MIRLPRRTAAMVVRRIAIVATLAMIIAACTQAAEETTTTTTVATTTTTTVATTTTTIQQFAQGDAIRGGLMYDKWWKVVDAYEPTESQPLWATQSSNERSGADSWRCKECHGWDYRGVDGAYGSGSHMTGFAGIWDARDKAYPDLKSALTSGDHDFSIIGDEAIEDLITFIQTGLFDFSPLVAADKAVSGNVDNGADLYHSVCAECHGTFGQALNFGNDEDPAFVAHVAMDNPWEFMHKVMFGQPGSDPAMPSAFASGWSLDDVRDVVAFSQTLPTEPVTATDLELGGLIYDKWWKAIGVDEPTTDQPLWVTQTTNERSGADSWRCKECHGWDYRGAGGAYASGSHFTGFPGIYAAGDKSDEELATALTTGDHDFGSVLDESQIAALVTFLQNGLTDMNGLFSLETKAAVDPDLAAGQALVEAQCAACHGKDGKAINFGSESEPEYLGDLARANPWETAHKILFGHPGSNPVMPGMIENGWQGEDVRDAIGYLQSIDGPPPCSGGRGGGPEALPLDGRGGGRSPGRGRSETSNRAV